MKRIENLCFRLKCHAEFISASPWLKILKQVQDYRLVLILIFTFLIFNLDPRPTRAQEMTSENFKIQGGNFNMTSGSKSSTNFNLSDVVGETAAGVFASKGFLIQSGFLNVSAGETFTFTVTPALLDFGQLIANNPIERELHIGISTGNVAGYKIGVSENHPLSSQTGAEIPDTTCDPADGGASKKQPQPCTYSIASKWMASTTYGFGYRMTGRTVSSNFSASNLFRPYAATSRNEDPALIMQSTQTKVTDSAVMSVKVNIDQHQPVGIYTNNLRFTASVGI